MDGVLEHKIPTTSWYSTNCDNGYKPAMVGVASLVYRCSSTQVVTHLGQTFPCELKLQGCNNFLFQKQKYGGGEHDECPERNFASEVSAVAAFCVLLVGATAAGAAALEGKGSNANNILLSRSFI
jgi:hypothetical protein